MMDEKALSIVARLMDSPGVCLVYRPGNPEDGCLPVLVRDGRIHLLVVGKELEPEGFEKDIDFDGPFIPNHMRSWT